MKGKCFFTSHRPLLSLCCLLWMINFATTEPEYDVYLDPQAEPFPPSSDNQLYNLGKPNKVRFELKDITWSAQPGEAEVCLWQDDRIAALCITIDDNCAMDIPWWREMAKKFGLRFTWFLITSRVDKGNTPMWGTWEQWRELVAEGHAVQSHSHTHTKGDNKASEKKLRMEYGASKKAIEDNIPGYKCLTIGFPYHDGNKAMASEYFIAVRAGVGRINRSQATDYTGVNGGDLGQGMINCLLTGRTGEGYGPNWVNLREKDNRRGWISPLYHYVKDKAKAENQIEHLASYKDRIWIDTFVNLSLYAQERDTATIQTIVSAEDKIEFHLADKMHDEIFTYPLTIKVRLPESWSAVNARQAGKSIVASYIEHEGVGYALVSAVPDRGSVTLTPSQI